jgi:Fic family protein
MLNYKPQNLPPDFNFKTIKIYEALAQANKYLAELNALIYSMPKYELFLAPLTANEAVKSSEIEQIFTTTIDLLQSDLFPEIEVVGMLKETKNYRDALLYGYELVKNQGLLINRNILEIQKTLEPNKSGFRNTLGTHLMNSKKEIVYSPPQSKQEILNLMQDLENFIHKDESLDPLIKVAITHFQFESIHPFFDGNGRTGRIIIILQMVLYDLIRYPVLFLSGYINENKADYYRLIQEVRDFGKWEEWVVFILNGVAVQSKHTSSQVVALNKLKAEIKHKLKTEFTKFYKPNLLDYLFSKPFYTQNTMTKELEIHRNTTRKYLQNFIKIGVLEINNKPKEKIYFIPKFLEIMNK